jgi:DNA processing protein
VAAVPGSVLNSRARGTNALLRDGATLVRDAQDVLDALFDAGCAMPAAPADPAAQLEPRLRALLDAVQGGGDTVAALSGTGQPTSAVLAGLAELELLGFLRRDPAGRYGRVPA